MGRCGCRRSAHAIRPCRASAQPGYIGWVLTNDQDGANQSAPFLVSNRGRYIWSEDAFTFEFVDGTLRVIGGNPVVGAGRSQRWRRIQHGVSRALSPTGVTPAAAMFLSPQYNTWIEMPYLPTQEAYSLCSRLARFWVSARTCHH